MRAETPRQVQRQRIKCVCERQLPAPSCTCTRRSDPLPATPQAEASWHLRIPSYSSSSHAEIELSVGEGPLALGHHVPDGTQPAHSDARRCTHYKATRNQERCHRNDPLPRIRSGTGRGTLCSWNHCLKPVDSCAARLRQPQLLLHSSRIVFFSRLVFSSRLDFFSKQIMEMVIFPLQFEMSN